MCYSKCWKEKNQSENGLKRTIWRGCIQLKIKSFFIEIYFQTVWKKFEIVKKTKGERPGRAHEKFGKYTIGGCGEWANLVYYESLELAVIKCTLC